jgi:hypothetical protein
VEDPLLRVSALALPNNLRSGATYRFFLEGAALCIGVFFMSKKKEDVKNPFPIIAIGNSTGQPL